jgi:hypothetical protein
MSGLTETEVMPHCTSLVVSSGYTEGACPQIDEVTLLRLVMLTALYRDHRTASSRSSNTSASLGLSLSTPSVS